MPTSSTSNGPVPSLAGGFSLVELMVSIAIMLVVISVIILGQSKYTGPASIQASAEDVSLSLREAQVYGVSVKERATGTADFSSAYGVEFRLPGAGGSNDAYVAFADRTADGTYVGSWSCPTGGSNECISKTMIQNGNTISALCSLSSGGTEDCSLGAVAVTYLRPASAARILYYDSAGSLLPSGGLVGARVKLASIGGTARSVAVYASGQISIQ